MEPGETALATSMREFAEEAMNSLEASSNELEETKQLIEKLFHSGTQVWFYLFPLIALPHHKFLLRCMQGTLMTLEILTMHGWRRWPLTSTMKQVPSLLYPHSMTPPLCTHPGEAFSRIKLQAGDDAGAVKWTELSKSLDLYASHTQLVQEVVKLRNAAW